MVGLRRLGKRDGVAIHGLKVELEAVLDRRGVWLAEAIPLPWQEVRLKLTISTDADDARRSAENVHLDGMRREAPSEAPSRRGEAEEDLDPGSVS